MIVPDIYQFGYFEGMSKWISYKWGLLSQLLQLQASWWLNSGLYQIKKDIYLRFEMYAISMDTKIK